MRNSPKPAFVCCASFMFSVSLSLFCFCDVARLFNSYITVTSALSVHARACRELRKLRRRIASSMRVWAERESEEREREMYMTFVLYCLRDS